MKSNTIKRICSLIMAMVIIVGLLPVSAFAANNTVVVLSASDYQAKGTSPQSNTSTILSRIKADYASADGFLFGGDYYQDSLDTTTMSVAGKNELNAAISAAYPNLANRVYIQGNHDADSLVSDGTLSSTGAHDTANYGVYAINEKDYPWGWQVGSSFQSTCQNTANALDAYLDAKANISYSKPIFVITHVPLHYTPRTDDQGDGKYAKYLYDVLDEAGEKGLNIIFLFGHNHSNTYDDYLGGGQIYLPKGSNICIANEGNTSPYFTDTLNFTYMNCGYVGYIGGKAGTNLSISVFEITNNKVIVKRYGINGIVDLKAAGKTTSGAPDADTSTIASGAEISTTGEHNYTSVTVDATCTEAGSVTYTCVTCGDSYEEPIAALGHNYTTSAVTAPTCTKIGYTVHTCTACGVYYNDSYVSAIGHSNIETVIAPTCTTAGCTTYTCTTCGHSTAGDSVPALGHNYISSERDGYVVYTCINSGCSSTYTEEITGDFTYSKVTKLSNREAYVITLYSGGKYYALSHKNNILSPVQVTVSQNQITSDVTADMIWDYNNKKLFYTDANTTYYLYAASSGLLSAPTLQINTAKSTNVSISGTKLKVGSYYLRYSGNAISLNKSASTTYLFNQVEN